MSRIGKKPIQIPDKVKVTVNGSKVDVTGPLGTLHLTMNPGFKAEVANNVLTVSRPSEERESRSQHGLYRSLLQNMVTGVVTGYTKILDIVGVGYKAALTGKNLDLALGFSHPVLFPIPDGLKVTVDKGTRITISGADKQLVGEVSASIRKIRPPEPYQGKGIRYADEVVKKKVGKAASAVGAGGK